MNPFLTLSNLLPKPRIDIGTVTTHNDDGTSTIELMNGGIIRARGQSVAVGQKAFVRAGLVEGQAPNLSGVVIEI